MKYQHSDDDLKWLAEFIRDVDYMIEATNEWYDIAAMVYAEAMGMI